MIPALTSSEFAGSLTRGIKRAAIRARRGLANELNRVPACHPEAGFQIGQWSLGKKQKAKR
jgi:hypothetical protein